MSGANASPAGRINPALRIHSKSPRHDGINSEYHNAGNSPAYPRYGIGAGLGYYLLNGTSERSGLPDIEIKGSTVGFHFMAMGEWEVSPGFGITGNAGYRVANITDTEFDGQGTSPKSETDYSGLVLRGGLVFSMPNSK